MAEALQIEPLSGFGLATLMARRGVNPDAISEKLGCPLPTAGCCAQADGITAISTGPNTWLLHAEHGESVFSADIAQKLAGLASVSDQSGGYALFRLTGADARKLLQRGAPIDLHPAAFPSGSAAVTVVAHMGVILWQTPTNDAFNVAVFRSFAESFSHWMETVEATLT